MEKLLELDSRILSTGIASGAYSQNTGIWTTAQGWIWGDSNGSVSPSSNTIGIVGTGNGNQIVNAFSLAPAASAAPTHPSFFANFV